MLLSCSDLLPSVLCSWAEELHNSSVYQQQSKACAGNAGNAGMEWICSDTALLHPHPCLPQTLLPAEPGSSAAPSPPQLPLEHPGAAAGWELGGEAAGGFLGT